MACGASAALTCVVAPQLDVSLNHTLHGIGRAVQVVAEPGRVIPHAAGRLVVAP